jgi:hypothetical protein
MVQKTMDLHVLFNLENVTMVIVSFVFNLFDVSTTLRYYHLEMKNLNQIIKVIKKWAYDPCLNCTPNADLKDYQDYIFFGQEKL